MLGSRAVSDSGTFDYIVVGAGSSGCVVASRLAARARVLLLEEGPPDTGVRDGTDLGPLISQTANAILAAWNPAIIKLFHTVPQAHLNGKSVVINRGIVRGGCSTVNGMIYVRGNRRDFDAWAQLGNDGWSYGEVLPYFKKSEDFDGAPLKYAPEDLEYHGHGGPLHVRPVPNPSPLAQAFVAAAGERGFQGGDPAWDYNGRRQEGGVAPYQVTVTADGQRASTAEAFLDGLPSTAQLTVLTGTTVARVLLDGHRAVGVECVSSDASKPARQFRAEREVILCAGAFGSPKLLMLSGIGPADDLRAKGLGPRVDLPGVGQNLQDHLMILLFHVAAQDPGQAGFTAEAGLFLNTRDRSGAASPDLQIDVLARMPTLPDALAKTFALPDAYFLFVPTVLQPRSRGSVTVRSDQPTDDVLIQPNYLERDADVQVLMAGIELTRDIVATRSLAPFVNPGVAPFALPNFAPTRLPLPARGSTSSLREFIAATPTTPWHPVGTCKMGRDGLAVVDPSLRVYGVERLRVADASIMPTITAANTNAACIMIGEKCADLVGA
jgi:choline dehydrogenase